jgi:hypothetical protein
MPSAGAAIPCDTRSCLVVGESAAGKRFAVVVAGPPLSRDGGRQSRGALASLDPREWLEGANADLHRLNANPAAPECTADPSVPAGSGSRAFNRLASGQGRNANDAVVTPPPGARP